MRLPVEPPVEPMLHVDGVRLRYPARFLRWRPDRHARSCPLDQLR
ncbi:MAG TPA: hypothetical protein VHF47_02685 [Acidimicrobiales bacterium]|nr:hypothetical protein [Acidimicrobiales bacterium]